MRVGSPFFLQRWLAMLSCVLLTGCASYHPQSLPTAPDLARAPQVTVSASRFDLPGLTPQPVSPLGLNANTVMLLAVLHNPDLKAARLEAGIASAQLLQAGLLPNPQLDASFASSVKNYGGAIGLDEQIQSWITRGAARAAAAYKKKQVNLNILWQEWQIAEQAEQLFEQIRTESRIQGLDAGSASLLRGQYLRDKKAMEHGDALSTTVSADLAKLSGAEQSERQLQLQANAARHGLNALLGLRPEVRLHLMGFPHPAPLTASQYHAALIAVAHRRADLLALQAGYESQEEEVRRAVLGQFPALTAGVEMDRDPVEGVNSIGPHVTLSLPLFNHNQGQIALQRATRAVLRQNYQTRLDAAVSQADQVWAAIRIQRRDARELSEQIDVMQRTVAAAQRSLRENDLDASAYVSLKVNLLSRRAELIGLRGSMEQSRATLRMLLGLPFEAMGSDR